MGGQVTSPAFVGRARELAALDEALERADGGASAVLLVGGEAGVGKTRLVNEFAARHAGTGTRVLVGGCVPFADGGLPFAPAAEALRDLAVQLGVEQVRALAGPSWPELGRLLPALGDPDRAAAGTGRRPAPEATDQLRLFEVVLGLLAALAEQAVLVLVAEDVHWADRSTRDLLAYLARNLRHPILRDLAVREAIALAVDRRQLLERTVGQFSDRVQVLGNRIWLTGQEGYEDHSGGYGRGDVAAAAARLERAGWAAGPGGIRVKDGQRLRLRHTTTQADRGRVQAGELLRDQLAKAGIDLELRPVQANTLFGDLLPGGGFDIAAFAWIGTPFAVSANRDLYVTGSAINYGRFADPEVDALFEQATAELDPARSTALANQIDGKLWEGLPSIPLYQQPTFLAWRGTLRNLVDNPTSEGPLWNAESWAFAAGATGSAP